MHVFLGDSWLRCERVEEVGSLTAETPPRAGELLEIRRAGQLIFGFPVESVRHVFDKGEHTVDVLCIDDTPVEFD